jgi:hypothetical protein
MVRENVEQEHNGVWLDAYGGRARSSQASLPNVHLPLNQIDMSPPPALSERINIAAEDK